MSYRLIIADDEPKIISLIKALGHWNQYDIEIIDECSDSNAALASIVENNPDLVISDIKMPGLDGIELIEEVRRKGCKALFILISGYRQFEYARSAIALNVCDYLLKPVSEEQLNLTLEKVIRQISAERELENGREEMERLRLLKERERSQKIWEDIIFYEKEAQRKLRYEKSFFSKETVFEEYGIEFKQDSFMILLIDSEMSLNTGTGGTSLFEDELERLLQKYVYVEKTICCAYHHVGYNIILNFDKKDQNKIRDGLYAMYFGIRNLQEVYGEFTLAIGVSDIKEKISELREAFLEARAAHWGKLVMQQNGILLHSQVDKFKKINSSYVISEEEIRIIKNCIRYLRREELSEVFERIAGRTAGYSEVYPGSVNEAVYKLINSLDDCFDDEDQFLIHYSSDKAFSGARTYMQLMKKLYLVYENYIENKLKELPEKSGKPINEAIRFIKENYSGQISLEDAARAANVSSPYLSRIFKDEVGMGFLEYLTAIRIEVAEKLLAESSLAIRDIALKVGYPDEKYFSKLYKKNTGIKPSEYRKIYG